MQLPRSGVDDKGVVEVTLEDRLVDKAVFWKRHASKDYNLVAEKCGRVAATRQSPTRSLRDLGLAPRHEGAVCPKSEHGQRVAWKIVGPWLSVERVPCEAAPEDELRALRHESSGLEAAVAAGLAGLARLPVAVISISGSK